ncbi:TlpA family protein disulfide reductase [Chloroflexota bacterium]
MKIKLFLILMIVSILLITAGCSGRQPDVCADMGLITSMETPDTSLTMDNIVGSVAPNFTWQVVDCKNLEPTTQNMSLTDLQGKPVLVVFTYAEGSGCKECAAQMPFIEAVYNQPGQELTVLNIYTDTNAGSVSDYTAKKELLTFPALVDTQKKMGQYLLLRGYPVNVLIDSEGIIKQYKIGRFVDQADVESWLKSL